MIDLPDGDGWSHIDPQDELERKRMRLARARAILAARDPEALVEYADEGDDELISRARETGIYGATSDLTKAMRRLPDGRIQLAATFLLDAEAVEKIRQGYRCLHCQQDFIENGLPQAFPEECPTCGFRARDDQVAQLERDLYGEARVGDDETPAQRQARWDWEKSERRWRRIGGAGIVVPRDATI